MYFNMENLYLYIITYIFRAVNEKFEAHVKICLRHFGMKFFFLYIWGPYLLPNHYFLKRVFSLYDSVVSPFVLSTSYLVILEHLGLHGLVHCFKKAEVLCPTITSYFGDFVFIPGYGNISWCIWYTFYLLFGSWNESRVWYHMLPRFFQSF